MSMYRIEWSSAWYYPDFTDRIVYSSLLDFNKDLKDRCKRFDKNSKNYEGDSFYVVFGPCVIKTENGEETLHNSSEFTCIRVDKKLNQPPVFSIQEDDRDIK